MIVPSVRQALGSALLLIVSTGLALAVAEYVLRAQRAEVESSDDMDPGLLRYDANLGWTLKPLWRGRHRHHDFDVGYSTGIDAWRHTPAADRKLPGRDVVWVGDSFTFGLGVNDGDTFVERINASQAAVRHVNAGIPGVSTDQEMLLIERRVLPMNPAEVVLVVYLANDLFDNRLPFPLQADNAKPYFTLTAEGVLEARNIPVPRSRKPADGSQPVLADFVLGADAARAVGWLDEFEIARRLGWAAPEPAGWEAGMAARHEDELRLFRALLRRIQRGVAEAGAGFSVYLLPSRRAIEAPTDTMARTQAHLAARIREFGDADGIEVTDLTPALRAANGRVDGFLYHPNEGHLTPTGHRVVAEAILAGR
ncbi:MAG: SGNH/GDSL hydrolase family protein [Gammaproteobacteria bacterium]|nr:SGNH/GDSL hydrolase family protein [Gammaproteobacteria bacterium]